MRISRTLATLCGATLLLTSGMALAADKPDLGKREYQSNCAVCHGTTGKGDGPYAGLGNQAVSNLTVLAKNNGGVYPFARVYEVIDGTKDVKAHGTRDMPIWGNDYKLKAAEYYMDVPYDTDAFVRARILALTEYLYRLQAK